ncbi:PIN domain-containing protein [Thiobacillus sp. 63-78]|uniref:PIN domain-containing protein n=1 Tax=Thiobacillus sp. 63-78 TaxID=1895859 RepID=UPI000A74D653|nr:PIN domain-containing protein [Thiobacillus sp. 63-78]
MSRDAALDGAALLVLDTNVVLDLLHFDDAPARPLRHAIESGRARCVVSNATLDEWRRVLAYPAFGLDVARQAVLFDRYQSLAWPRRAVAAADPPREGGPVHRGSKPAWGRLPRCSDPDDQKFIELAAAAPAQGLVSKDRALLSLRRHCMPYFRIMNPAEALRWLDVLPARQTAA